MRAEALAHRLHGHAALIAIAAALLGAIPCAAIAADPPAQPVVVLAPLALEPEGVVSQPPIITRGINFMTRAFGEPGQLNNGFYPETSNMITGSGWISLGPGYRRWLLDDHAVVEGSTAVSWRFYKMAQGRFEFTNLARDRVSIGTRVMWQDLTQLTYFGEGPNSSESTRSEYRMQTTDLVGYAAVRPARWLSIDGIVGWLDRPNLLDPSGTFRRDHPSTLAMFPSDPSVRLVQQPSYVHSEASVTADTRDSDSHPASGGVYRAAMTAYSDRDAGTFSFRRYEAEGAHSMPLADTVVLAVRGWFAGTETDAGRQVPFYLLPSLGGHNTLRAYHDYRFHDRNLVLGNAELRVAVFTHLDLAGFVDAGNVAPRVRDLNFDRRDWGLGLRMHTNRTTFARLDVAHGSEGWMVLFRTNDPFRLARFSERSAAVPFVP